jgi:UDP-glucose 4-epimerase
MELANVDVIFVTGSSGRLGSALCEDLCNGKTRIIGIDPKPGRHTSYHSDRVEDAFATLKRGEIFVVFHCGALHKPDITRNTREEFIQANVLFTARLIRLARENEGLVRFVFTSTTSVFGAVMSDRDSRSKCKVHGCAFLTNASEPCPKNIYGITKLSAESVIYDHLDGRFITLRACRFFPEEDDRETKHDDLSEDNLKFLHVLNGRRLLLSDVVAAHKAANIVAQDGRTVRGVESGERCVSDRGDDFGRKCRQGVAKGVSVFAASVGQASGLENSKVH